MNIIPIAVTQIDWNLFIKGTEKILGYSSARILDQKNLTFQAPDAYFYALSLFENQDNKEVIFQALKHTHVSFLMEIPDFLYSELLEGFYHEIDFIRSKEAKLRNETVIIATGNLHSWREVCLHLNKNFHSRELSYKLYELLRRFNIFNAYKVEENIDGSRFLQKRY